MAGRDLGQGVEEEQGRERGRKARGELERRRRWYQFGLQFGLRFCCDVEVLLHVLPHLGLNYHTHTHTYHTNINTHPIYLFINSGTF